jgi:hypothetical protein
MRVYLRELIERLRRVSIVGDWEVLLVEGGECCLEADPNGDTILVSTQQQLHGMLKKWLYGIFPKGVRGNTVYVARIDRSGRTRMSRPCGECMDNLRERGIRRIVYTTDSGWTSERI